jgi:Ca2+/Na+ antiporter
MWLSDFYIKYFTWLSNLTRIDKFLPWVAEDSSLNSVPVQIIKFLFEMPFMLIVLLIPLLFMIRIGAWTIGCWFGCADNIYKD